jgi:hypothetical protein
MNQVLAALAGAATTALLGALLSYLNYRRRRRRLLDIAALRCLDRLRKMEAACDGKRPRNESEINRLARAKTVHKELTYLGPDLDRYLVSIGSAWPYARSIHFPLYEQFRPILIEHDLRTVSSLASNLEPYTFGARSLRRRWRATFGSGP